MDYNQSTELSKMFAPVLDLLPGLWVIPYQPSEKLKAKMGILGHYNMKKKYNNMLDENKIFTGGLSVHVTLENLEYHFGKFGIIKKIIYEQDVYDEGKMNNYAEIIYHDKISVKRAESWEIHMIQGKRIDALICRNYNYKVKHNDINLGGDAIIYQENLPKQITDEDLKLIFMDMDFHMRQVYIIKSHNKGRPKGVVQFYNPKIAEFLGERKFIQINEACVEMNTLEQVYEKGRNGHNFNDLYRNVKTRFNFPLLMNFEAPLLINFGYTNNVIPVEGVTAKDSKEFENYEQIKSQEAYLRSFADHNKSMMEYMKNCYQDGFTGGVRNNLPTNQANVPQHFGVPSPENQIPGIESNTPKKNAPSLNGKLSRNAPEFLVGDQISPNSESALVKAKMSFTSRPFIAGHEIPKDVKTDFQASRAELLRQFNDASLPGYELTDSSFNIPKNNKFEMTSSNLSKNSPICMVDDQNSQNNKSALVKSKASFKSRPFKASDNILKDDFPGLISSEKSPGNIPGFVDGEIPQDKFSGYIGGQKPQRKSSKKTPNQSDGNNSDEDDNSSCSSEESNEDEEFSDYGKKEDDDSSNELSIIESESHNFDDSISAASIRKNNTIGQQSGFNSFRVMDNLVNKLSDNKNAGALTCKNNAAINPAKNFEDFLKHSLVEKTSPIAFKKELQTHYDPFKSPSRNDFSIKQIPKTNNFPIDKKIGAVGNHLQDKTELAKFSIANSEGKGEFNNIQGLSHKQVGYMNNQR